MIKTFLYNIPFIYQLQRGFRNCNYTLEKDTFFAIFSQNWATNKNWKHKHFWQIDLLFSIPKTHQFTSNQALLLFKHSIIRIFNIKQNTYSEEEEVGIEMSDSDWDLDAAAGAQWVRILSKITNNCGVTYRDVITWGASCNNASLKNVLSGMVTVGRTPSTESGWDDERPRIGNLLKQTHFI